MPDFDYVAGGAKQDNASPRSADIKPEKNRELAVKSGIFFLAFMILSFFVFYGIPKIEIKVFKAINESPFGIEGFFKYFMPLGTLWGAGLIMLIALILRKRYIFYALLGGGALAWAFGNLAKILINRDRPVGFLENVIIREETLVYFGFPSNHTAMAAALAVILSPWIKKPFRVLLIIYVALIGLGRIYLGVHFPSDVLGGLFLGLATGYALRLIINILKKYLP